MTNIADIVAKGDFEKRPPQNNPIKRYFAKPTRKTAIDAMCAHCVGCTSVEQGNGITDHLERGFRDTIADCASTGCPLHKFRPFQKEGSK